jgi:hypothetical protein
MRRRPSRPAGLHRMPLPSLACPLVACLLVACGDAPQTRVVPFSGEQIGRIDAGIRADAPAAEPDLTEADRPLWISIALRDDRERMVVHVRLGVPGDLANVARHEARCARVRERMQTYLLPGQRAELYLVFDDSVHPCLGEWAPTSG